MKHKKLLFTLIVAAVVLAFSVITLGAGKNSDNTYVGTWYRELENGNGRYLFVYPCHVGEMGTEVLEDHRMNINRQFDWCVDNGYLVRRDELLNGNASLMCYLSSDGGKTMESITGGDSVIYTKIE